MSDHQSPASLQRWIAQADELLTDSQHPLDPKQATKVHLNLLREIANAQLEMQRQVTDYQLEITQELKGWKGDLETRRAAMDERVSKIEDEIEAMKRLMTEYPSLTWLLRHRTSKVVFAIVISLYLFLSNYPLLAAIFRLPPLP